MIRDLSEKISQKKTTTSDLGGVHTEASLLVPGLQGAISGFTYEKIDTYGVCIYFYQALVRQG